MVSSPSDPKRPDINDGGVDGSATYVGGPDVNLLEMVGRAEEVSRNYQLQELNRPLQAAYRAWHNRHHEGSKYLGPAWKGRSSLFVPKTRSSVRKTMAQAASALFATDDVVTVTAEHEDNDIQRATAAVIGEDLNFRLTRQSRKSGMPWFLISMGACLDSVLTGVTVSKQFWEYQEVKTGNMINRIVEAVDPETGAIAYEQVEEEEVRVVKDRPMIEVVPIENVMIDPAAPWHDTVQLGSWFIVRYPMHLDEALTMMRQGDKTGYNAWLPDVDAELLQKGREDVHRSTSRRVREGGNDRYERRQAGQGMDVIWINENFFRVKGEDYHFWSVGRHGYLSEVRPVLESYPEQGGDRPYIMGVGQVDTHRVFPMSAVESWQPLQQEINDITNLRLDTLKRSIAPLARVRKGKNIDLQQVQRRGRPDAILMLDNLDDVEFEQTPGPSSQSYTETSVSNSALDELSGTFSSTSVQSNRQLNETVGGMNLLNSSANAMSEFDLRVWVETWTEPALRQVVNLIKYYENDERLVALAGSKAEAVRHFNYLPTLDDFDAAEVMLRVNVGIGAADPMQKLGKLDAGIKILLPLFEAMGADGIEMNAEVLIEEVMGAAGFRDGRRFFKFPDPNAPKEIPPEVQKILKDFELKERELEVEREKTDKDNQTKIEVENIKGRKEITTTLLNMYGDQQRLQVEERQKQADRIAQVLSGRNQGGDGNNSGGNGALPRIPGVTAPQTPETLDNRSMINQQIMQQIQQVSSQVDAVSRAVNVISEQIRSPAEIIRDPRTGRPVAVRKNGQTQRIVRDARGRAIGTAPLE